MNIKEELIGLVSEIIDKKVEKNKNNKNLDLINDLGYDSFFFIALFVEIETKFNIELSLEDMDLDNVRNFDKLLEIVKKYVHE